MEFLILNPKLTYFNKEVWILLPTNKQQKKILPISLF